MATNVLLGKRFLPRSETLALTSFPPSPGLTMLLWPIARILYYKCEALNLIPAAPLMSIHSGPRRQQTGNRQ